MDLSKPIAVRPKKKIYRDGDRVIKVMDEDYSAPDVLREAFNLSVCAKRASACRLCTRF